MPSLLEDAWVTVDVPVAAPVTVNVWAVSQLLVVNVRAVGATDAMLVVPLVGVTVTWPVGSVSNTTVYVLVAPFTTVSDSALTVTAAVSSSSMVTIATWPGLLR